MSVQNQETAKMPERFAGRNDAMLERECRIASKLLCVCGIVSLVLAVALWA